MATLEQLLAVLTEEDSDHYALTGTHPLRLLWHQEVQFNGGAEVQAIAVQRARRGLGPVQRALVWNGTALHPWEIRRITSATDAEFCGIVDHGYED